RWCIVDIRGKHGRVRTVPMSSWAKVAIDEWAAAAEISEGAVFRGVNKGDRVTGDSLTSQGVWRGVEKDSDVAPHDLRSYAECRIMPNRSQDLRFGGWSASFGRNGLGMIRMAKAASGRPVVRHPAGIAPV